ncbi:MAG: hypothetical protein J6S67_24580 [Methanobrevibacter sp.]|nr:hypothetical protein [Methanobrevibacter sp.]
MSITVNLYSFTKRENSTKRPTGSGTSFGCTMIDDTSLMNPTFKLSIASNPIGYNYAYVADFDRYYFITEIRTYQNFWYVSCTCDVLASFKTEIGSQSHYILRSASASNGAISDTLYPATTQVLEQLYYPDNDYDPMAYSNGHSYIVGIVGNTDVITDQIGTLIYYWFNDASLHQFIKYLTDNIASGDDPWGQIAQSEYSEGVQKALIDPIQYIKSAFCLPVAIPETGYGVASSVKFGYYSWDVPSGYTVKKVGAGSAKIITKETASITIPTHPQAATRGSYLNCAPYSYYYLHYGPWGDIELDPLLINGNSKLKIYITYDLIKGIGRLMVTGNEYPHRVFFNGSANVGVDINLSQIYKDALGYEAATTSGIFGSVAAGATVGMSTNPVADLAKGLSFASSSVQDMTRLNYPVVKGIGDSGSFLAMFDSYNLYMISKFNYIVDENNTELGRPLCAVRQISNLSGYILCQGADCQIPGTQEEAIKINQYMNTGFFYE